MQLCGSALVFFMLPYFGLETALWIVVIFTGINIGANILYVLGEWWWAKKYIPAEYEKAHANKLAKEKEEKEERKKLLSIQEPLEEKPPPPNKLKRIGLFLKELWDDVKQLPFIYWMVVMMIFCLSPILYTFTAFGPLYFEAKWGLDPKEAGSITSVLYATILFAPFAGNYISFLSLFVIFILYPVFSVIVLTTNNQQQPITNNKQQTKNSLDSFYACLVVKLFFSLLLDLFVFFNVFFFLLGWIMDRFGYRYSFSLLLLILF